MECFRIQTRRDEAQKELVSWLRLSDGVARRHCDGLTPEGMEITGFKGWFVRHFVNAEDFMKESFRQQGIDHAAKLAGQGGGWLVITSPGRTVSDLAYMARRSGPCLSP